MIQFWVYFRRLWRYVALGSIICVSMATAYLLQSTPMYSAETSVLLDTQSNDFLRKQNIMPDPVFDAGMVDSQAEVLSSETLATTVVKKLGLQNDPEFVGETPGPIDRVLSVVSEQVAKLKAAFGPTSAMTPGTPIGRAVQTFQSRLSIRRVGITYVINILFSSESAQKAALIANSVAQAYIDQDLEASFNANKRATEWLVGRLKEIGDEASDADKSVQTYKQASGIVDTGRGLLGQQQMADLNSQITLAKTGLAEAKAKLARIQVITESDVLDGTVSEALNNPIITRLRAQYLDLQSKAADIARRLGEQHQAVKKLRDQQDELKKAISSEVKRIADATLSDVEVLAAREHSLEQSLAELVAGAGASDLAQVKLRALESSADSFRQLYSSFLQKAQEAGQQQTSPMSTVRIISPATPPLHKSSPKTALVVLGALFAGAAVGGGVGFLKDRNSETFTTAEDAYRETGIPCLGVLPQLRLRAGDFGGKLNATAMHEYVITRPFSRFTEVLRSVKLSIDQASAASSRVVAITSSAPKEGKTTVAVNLATLAARHGTRTLLIDCDMHARELTRLYAPEVEAGLLEALAAPQSLKGLVKRQVSSGLDVLPCVVRERLSNSFEIVSSVQMKELLDYARNSYELVVLDLPPSAAVVDARAAAVLVDFILFVVAWNRTTKKLIEEALLGVDVLREKTIGTLLNMADPKELRQITAYRSESLDAYYVE